MPACSRFGFRALVFECALLLPRRDDHVQIDNPISVEQTIVRSTLLPGLLDTFSVNADVELPQRIFEVGFISRLDAEAETGARERIFTVLLTLFGGFALLLASIGLHGVTAYLDPAQRVYAFVRGTNGRYYVNYTLDASVAGPRTWSYQGTP